MTAPEQKNPELRPTLWRTCRALANRPRLRMIGLLVRRPDQDVTEIARTLDLTTGTASQYLRLLNSRGLLQARRAGRFVTYRISADRSLAESAALLKELEHLFMRTRNPVDQIFRYATAFTHPRRITIVRALAKAAPPTLTALRHATGISPQALGRHLAKLEERGLVARGKKLHPLRYQLAIPRNRFARTLVNLAGKDS